MVHCTIHGRFPSREDSESKVRQHAAKVPGGAVVDEVGLSNTRPRADCEHPSTPLTAKYSRLGTTGAVRGETVGQPLLAYTKRTGLVVVCAVLLTRRDSRSLEISPLSGQGRA